MHCWCLPDRMRFSKQTNVMRIITDTVALYHCRGCVEDISGVLNVQLVLAFLSQALNSNVEPILAVCCRFFVLLFRF